MKTLWVALLGITCPFIAHAEVDHQKCSGLSGRFEWKHDQIKREIHIDFNQNKEWTVTWVDQFGVRYVRPVDGVSRYYPSEDLEIKGSRDVLHLDSCRITSRATGQYRDGSEVDTVEVIQFEKALDQLHVSLDLFAPDGRHLGDQKQVYQRIE